MDMLHHFFLTKHLTKKNDLSLNISVLVFISNEIFYHFTITRTESLAYLFFILQSFSSFTRFNNRNKLVLYSLLSRLYFCF